MPRIDQCRGEPDTQMLRPYPLPAGLTDLHFHDLRHTFVTRKVREGWDYKRLMAIAGGKIFAVFQRGNNPSEEDSKVVVLADPPRKVVG